MQDDHPIISSYELQEKITERGKARPLLAVRSKLPSLDDAIENFQDGELYAVSGPTKNGKTLLCQTLTKNFAEQQVYSLWFSFEVHPRQFIACFEELPLFYVPDGLKAGSIEWVEGKILESLKQHNTRVVFVDHLHFLFDMIARQNISLTIGTVVRRLKLLAVRERLLIFLLCHTTKPGGEGAGLSYASIRDSSFVSQESDSVVMVQRTGENEGQLRVEFHRRTGVFERPVQIVKAGKYFVEKAPLP